MLKKQKTQQHFHTQTKSIPDRTLYADSSVISQYLGLSKGLHDSPTKKTATAHFFSPGATQTKMQKFRGLTKNYYQTKYLLLQDGTQEQRIGWRKYLLHSFKDKLESWIKKKKITRSPQKSRQLIPPLNLHDDFMAVNDIIKRTIPNLDFETVQDSLLKKNELLLITNWSMNYDQKVQLIMKQFEDIVNRIEKEAFRQRIPANFNTAMSNYNDYYDIAAGTLKPKLAERVTAHNQQRKFVHQSAYNLFDDIDCEYYEPELILHASPTEPTELNDQVENISEFVLREGDIKDEVREMAPLVIREDTKEMVMSTSRSNRSRPQTMKTQRSPRCLIPHISKSIQRDYIDDLLDMENVFDEDLDRIINRPVGHHYDSYIFIEEDEEIIYKVSCDWIDVLQLL